jgi:2-dehydro-3-deoxygluconokinase
LTLCDIGLPTLEDERALGSAQDAASVAEHWRALGVGEVVVKMGAAGCLAEGEVVPPPRVLAPVDTSGAGDAFDAGYLAARLRGDPVREAATSGHRLAGWVVQRRGAIPARDAEAPY